MRNTAGVDSSPLYRLLRLSQLIPSNSIYLPQVSAGVKRFANDISGVEPRACRIRRRVWSRVHILSQSRPARTVAREPEESSGLCSITDGRRWTLWLHLLLSHWLPQEFIVR